MIRKFFLLLCLFYCVPFWSSAQSTKNPVTVPPPGNIKLLDGYVHIKKRGIDTSVGEISKPNGMTIRYDNGALAGRVAGRYCGAGQCVWYKKQRVYGRDVWIGLTQEGRIMATFPEIYVNFYAETLSSVDIADFQTMILTYGHDEPAPEIDSRYLKPGADNRRLFPVSQNRKWGYVNEKGEIIIEPKFVRASEFREGLASVVVIDQMGNRNLYGYIDKTGKFAVEPQYDDANDFSEGLAMVIKDYRCGYIDTTGKEVIPLQFVEAYDFSEGLAAVYFQPKNFKSDSNWGYINKKGETAIPARFFKANDFRGGLASVLTGKFGGDNPEGFIDTTGKFIISPRFEMAGEFSEGLIPVEIGGRNKKLGKGISTHIDGKWGFVDRSGKVVIKPVFDFAHEFSEGLASVTIGEKYGYIDKNGKIVIQPQFEYSSGSYRCAYFIEGLACFERDGKVGFIDRTGNVAIPPQFDFATKFTGGFARVGFPNGYGIIDRAGKTIWKPKS